MNTIKKGSRGEDVRTLQMLLNKAMGTKLVCDAIAGSSTESVLKEFQRKHQLVDDGICGPSTWSALLKYNTIVTPEHNGLYTDYFLKPGQYIAGNYPKSIIVLHHTAGSSDGRNVIHGWNTDNQAHVATEFVISGINSKNGDTTLDGKIIHAFPTGSYGFHIGRSSIGLDKISTAIEVCNFGHLTIGKDGKYHTYTGAICQPEQVVTLSEPFRGYTHYHRYSDKQLESLRKLMLFISERDNIDLHAGLYANIKKFGAKAFEYFPDIHKIPTGVITHANVRKDKEDIFPQPEMIDMILSL